MDYLQYYTTTVGRLIINKVLNLIINGLPSILLYTYYIRVS